MAHNEDIYPDSYAFKPERFLPEALSGTPPEFDPMNIAFGYGRRSVLTLKFLTSPSVGLRPD